MVAVRVAGWIVAEGVWVTFIGTMPAGGVVVRFPKLATVGVTVLGFINTPLILLKKIKLEMQVRTKRRLTAITANPRGNFLF